MALASKDLNRTESKNRFRFQSFNERIKHLKLNATQHVRSRYEYDDPEMGNSFFVEELELLKDLDASVAFREFNFEISQFAQSLQQILFHKEAVVDMLIATLEKKQIIESILKLMVALARDLQDEFTPFFTKVVASILGLLTTREIEIVEAIFNALVLIFRYLHQEVAGLFLEIFELFNVALNDHRLHVRNFTAEALSYLFRKLPSSVNNSMHSDILDLLRSLPSDNKIDGYARFYYNVIKQVRNTLHSKTKLYLKPLYADVFNYEQEANEPGFRMVQQAVEMLLHHCKSETVQPLMDQTMEDINATIYAKDRTKEQSLVPVSKALSILNLCLYARKGHLIADWGSIFQIVEHCAQNFSIEEVPTTTISFGLLLSNSPEAFRSDCEKCSKVVFQMDVKEAIIYIEMAKTIDYSVGRRYAVNFIHQMADTSSNIDYALIALAPPHSDQFDADSIGDFDQMDRLRHGPVLSGIRHILSSESIIDIKAISKNDYKGIGRLWTALNCLSLVEFKQSEIMPALLKLFSFAVNAIAKVPSSQASELLLLISSRTLEKITEFSGPGDKNLSGVWELARLTFLSAGSQSSIAVHAFSKFLDAYVSSSRRPTATEGQAIFDILKPNFSSHEKKLRLYSAHILRTLFPADNNQDNASILRGQVYGLIIEFDEIENTATTARDKNLCIKRLGQVILKYQQVDKKLLETVFQYLFAFLTEKFAPVLGPVTEVLVTLAKKYNHFFWIAYMDVFSKLDPSIVIEESTLEPEAPTDDFIEENFDAESKLKSIKRLTELSAQLRSTSSDMSSSKGVFAKNLHHALQVSRLKSSFDVGRYFSILLQTFKSLPNIFLDQSKFFVQQLFQASKDFMSEGRDALEGTSKVESLISKDVLKTRDIIFETLNIVKVLDKPEKLFREADVYSLCLQLLTTGDTAMQRLSLECILVWKEAPLVKISEQLRGLTDEVKFRDYLTTLDQESLNSLAEEDKSKVYNVLIRILFGKLISRRKKSSDRTGLKARRKAIFAFFVKLGDFERGLFFDILIQPFRKQIQQFELDMPIEPVSSYSDARGFELKYQLGFLNACEDLVKQFQSLVTPFIPSLLRALLFIGSSTSRHGVIEVEDDASSEIGDEDSSTNKSLRQLTIRRLNDLFSAEITFDYEPYLGDLFKIFIDPKLPNFDTENTQAPSSMLRLFKTWSDNPIYVHFLGFNPMVMEKIFMLLAAKAVNVSVVELVLSMTEAIFASDEGDKESTFMHSLIVPNASSLLRASESYR